MTLPAASPHGSGKRHAPKTAAAHPVYTGSIHSHMFMGNVVHTSTVLVRREWARRIGGFDLEMRPAGEDYDFHFRITKCGPVAFIDAPSILYCGGGVSASAAHLALRAAGFTHTSVYDGSWAEWGADPDTPKAAHGG